MLIEVTIQEINHNHQLKDFPLDIPAPVKDMGQGLDVLHLIGPDVGM
jgi:hypothetical protein